MTDDNHAPTTRNDLEITPRYSDVSYEESSSLPASRHVFHTDEDTALCGHPSTAGTLRREFADDERPEDALSVCSNCSAALYSRTNDLNYRGDDERWNAATDARDNDEITVTLTDGTVLSGVVDSEDKDVTDSNYRLVSFDTDPDNFNANREDDEATEFTLRAKPDEATVTRAIWGDDGSAREVESVELGGTHDYRADDDDEVRREVVEQSEQTAAHFYREAERMDLEGEDRLEVVNYAQVFSNMSYLLRSHDTETVHKARQRAERGVERVVPDEADDDETAAKRRGKLAAYEDLLDLLDRAEAAPCDHEVRGGWEWDDTNGESVYLRNECEKCGETLTRRFNYDRTFEGASGSAYDEGVPSWGNSVTASGDLGCPGGVSRWGRGDEVLAWCEFAGEQRTGTVVGLGTETVTVEWHDSDEVPYSCDTVADTHVSGPADPDEDDTDSDGPHVMTDGGTEPRFRVGEAVADSDRDQDESDEGMCFVLDPDAGRADAVEVGTTGMTVAGFNDDYPDDDRVVEVVFRSALNSTVPGWDEWGREDLDTKLPEFCAEWGVSVKTYDYPESRLEPEGEATTDGGECAECASLGGTCAECFIHRGKEWTDDSDDDSDGSGRLMTDGGTDITPEEDLRVYEQDNRPTHLHLVGGEPLCGMGHSLDELPNEASEFDRSVIEDERRVCTNCRRIFFSRYGHATDERAPVEEDERADEDAVSALLRTVEEGDALVWDRRSRPVPVARVEAGDDSVDWERRIWLVGMHDSVHRFVLVESTFDRTEWLFPYVERRADDEKRHDDGEWVRNGSVTNVAVAERGQHDRDVPPVPDKDGHDLGAVEAAQATDDGTADHDGARGHNGDDSVDWASLAN